MNLTSDLQLSYALAAAESAQSSRAYLNHVVINSDPEPKRFKALAEPWQWDRANYILPAVESVTGHNPGYGGPKNIWETMPRGHDKTSFIARMMNWVLCFSKRQNLRLLVAAKDSDQANILKDCMSIEAKLNPWFGNKLLFHQKVVWGPCGKLQIATADALGLFGHGIDLFVMEEITHWEDVLGQQVWTSLWSGRRKRPSAVLLVLSNAGFIDTWQWKIFEQAKLNKTSWKVFEAPGILASWMNAKLIEEDRKLLPPVEARRLLDNEWVDPGEESGYLTRREVLACQEESQRRGLVWTPRLDPGLEYILSIDYGPKRDRTAICLGHQLITGEVAVDRFWVWEGRNYPDGEVPVQAVRDLVEEQRRECPWLWLVVDPYQMKELVQYYKQHLPLEEFEARGGKSNFEMAECLRTQVVNRRLLWPPGIAEVQVGSGAGKTTEGLLEELPRLIIKKMAYGYRFDHLSGRHDDRACALGMMCVCAFNRPKPEKWIQRRRDVIHKWKTPDPFRTRGSSGRELYGVRS